MNNEHIKAFRAQKNNAKRRGIGWELTFDQWLEFWGADIDKRGSGRDSLQMQRPCDSGPYAVGNIRKGIPRQNGKTMSAMAQSKKAQRAAKEHQARLDALMFAPSAPDREDDPALDEDATGSAYGNRIQSSFPRSWQFATVSGKGQHA